MGRHLASKDVWDKIKANAALPRPSRSGTKESVLYLHLAYNLSRRRINWLLGCTRHLNGNNAERIIKRYMVKNYGGELLGQPTSICSEVIAELLAICKTKKALSAGVLGAAVDAVFQKVPPPGILQVTLGTSLIQPIDTAFRTKAYGAQMTNLVNEWFEELRKRFECHCHYYDTARSKHCGALPLETSHYTFGRASLIDSLAAQHRCVCDSRGASAGHGDPTHYRYELGDIYREFLQAHRLRPAPASGKAGRQDAVVFFCKDHHRQYDALVGGAATSAIAEKQLMDWRLRRIKPYL